MHWWRWRSVRPSLLNRRLRYSLWSRTRRSRRHLGSRTPIWLQVHSQRRELRRPFPLSKSRPRRCLRYLRRATRCRCPQAANMCRRTAIAASARIQSRLLSLNRHAAPESPPVRHATAATILVAAAAAAVWFFATRCKSCCLATSAAARAALAAGLGGCSQPLAMKAAFSSMAG